MEAAAGEVIVLDAVKIPTQAAYPLLGDKLGERELCKPRSKLAESGGGGFRAAGEADSPEEKEEGRGWEGSPEGDQGGQQSLDPAKAFGLLLH